MHNGKWSLIESLYNAGGHGEVVVFNILTGTLLREVLCYSQFCSTSEGVLGAPIPISRNCNARQKEDRSDAEFL
jgi:hypothetical protein